MTFFIKSTIGFFLSILIFNPAQSEIRLPAVIGTNMVLQQQSSVSVWGWADPSEKITITTSWSSRTDSTLTPSSGKWKLTIQTPVAGGPYTIQLKGSNTIILENVLIGEVWLCSGQSNMEWSARNNNKQSIEEAPNATNTQIRFFHVPQNIG
jgi:sialate O-acetylesterase